VRKKKILIVTGFFNPTLGYQEKYIAKYLSVLGHDVTLLTSDSDFLKYNTKHKEADKNCRFSIVRLPVLFFLRSQAMVLCKGVKKTVHAINPDITIVFGITQLFPLLAAMESKKIGSLVVGVFGDNHYQHSPNRSVFVNIIHKKLKYFLYRYFGRFANLISYTNMETYHILSDMFKNLNILYYNLPLGFDPDEKYYDPVVRENTRRKFNVREDDILILTSGRPNKKERFLKVYDLHKNLLGKGLKVKTVLIGAGNRSLIEDRDNNDVIVLPFIDSKKFNELLNAADIGIWDKPTISIKEAIGTGLFVVYPRTEALPEQEYSKFGLSINDNDDLVSIFENLLKDINNIRGLREKRFIESLNIHSYESIVKQFLDYLYNVLDGNDNKK